MRIIGGIHKGKRLLVPKGLELRPTTDFAKEALFNILANKIDFEECNVLDLFTGTGFISFEFASRGAKEIIAVDQNYQCVKFISETSKNLNLKINCIKKEVFEFLKSLSNKFDIIFADPPYELENIVELHQLIFEKKLLNPNGILIIEHGSKTNLESLTGFEQMRKYGNVRFSFFRNE